VGDGAATSAFNKFVSTYAAVATAPPCQGAPLTGTLAGVTLPPGVYCFDAAAALTGVLTLQGPAKGIWIFKIGTLGTGDLTGTNFSVVMAGRAQACNVTWWVADAATMTDSNLSGTILAKTGITLTRGTFAGDAYSKADVTITGTAVTGCKGK
jgi:Ice-binding-like